VCIVGVELGENVAEVLVCIVGVELGENVAEVVG
jgi:hypothetical protein